MDFVQNLRGKLAELPQEKLLDFIELQFKNLWTLQNNYMAKLDNDFGHEVALEFDNACFGRMSEVGARRIQKFLGLGDDIKSILTCLEYSVPEPGSEGEWTQVGDNKAYFKVTKCGMQHARLNRGAEELPCKDALIGVMDRTFKAINPKSKITRSMAPPDKHPDDLWCELEFEIEEDNS